MESCWPSEAAGQQLAEQAMITQPLGTLYSLFASVESAGLRQTSIIRSRDLLADGVIADRLDLEASTPPFRMERIRLAGEEPLALDTVWLPGDVGVRRCWRPTSPERSVRRTRRLGRRPGGRRPRTYPRVVLTGAEQRLLGIPPSTGALLITRLGWAAGRPVEWRRTLIRGDRFSLLAEFSTRTGYRLAPDSRYPVPKVLSGSSPFRAS